jgi:uncharacterized membrane protein YeiB
MLLLIALANVPLYLYGNGTFGTGIWLRGHPLLDQTVLFLQTVLVRGRAYPMFAFLFGYGIVRAHRLLPRPAAVFRRHHRGLRVAAWMSRHGHRGPAEVLLRRLTYGHRVSPTKAGK